MPLERFTGGSVSARAKLNVLVHDQHELATVRGDEQYVGINKGGSGTTVQVNIPAIARRMPKRPPAVFPVNLSQVGGTAGKWTYDIRHGLGPGTEDPLVAGPSGNLALTIDPRDPPHYLRPSPYKATRGLAHYKRNGYLTLDWLDNEIGGAFLVLVSADGGINGNSTTTCTLTYHVEDINGSDLGDGIAPVQPRLPFTRYIAGEGYGLADYDADANLVLIVVPEIPYVEACP